jgi:hypothetical protein
MKKKIILFVVVVLLITLPLIGYLFFKSLFVEGSMPNEDEIASYSNELKQEAKLLFDKYPKNDTWIDKTKWPPTIRKLSPLNIYVEDEGLYLEFKQDFVQAWGIFIPRNDSDFSPTEGHDPSFKKIKTGIYSYYVAG